MAELVCPSITLKSLAMEFFVCVFTVAHVTSGGSVIDDIFIETATHIHSGVARVCIWRGLAPKAPEAALGVGPGGGLIPPPGRGFGGITPEKILEI
jgi:hypothetical protein